MNGLTKEQFDKLWNINPSFSNPSHNYDNCYSLLNTILSLTRFTTDGKLRTFDLIYKRYKLHYQVKNTINEGVDPKYIKKENKVLSIYDYVGDEIYNSIEKVPMTQRHFYFWNEMTEEEVQERFKIFMSLCQKN